MFLNLFARHSPFARIVTILLPLLDIVFPPRETELLVRTAYANPTRLQALVRPMKVQDVTALLPYRDPLVQAIILETKFHRNKQALELLGIILADYIANYIKVYAEHMAEKYEEKPKLVLIPLPLGAKRRKERGYNQVEEIAQQALAGLTHMNVDLRNNILVRLRETVPQMTLGREARLENTHGAFGAVRPLDSSLIYVLLDDVLTTGATLSSAAAALRAAAATNLLIIAIAH